MNNKLKTVAMLVVFAVIVGAAYMGYDFLGEKIKTGSKLSSDELDLKDAENTGNNNADNSTENPDENQDKVDAQKGREEEKQPAQDFTVYDVDNNKVNLSDFKGKPIVVNFWTSWCPQCRREMPNYNAEYNEHKDDVVFMMVNLVDGIRETEEKALDYVKSQGFDFPVYFDTDQDAAYTYWVISIPTTLFIDRDGNIAWKRIGVLDMEGLNAGIELITK